jgi:hypothetical protein
MRAEVLKRVFALDINIQRSQYHNFPRAQQKDRQCITSTSRVLRSEGGPAAFSKKNFPCSYVLFQPSAPKDAKHTKDTLLFPSSSFKTHQCLDLMCKALLESPFQTPTDINLHFSVISSMLCLHCCDHGHIYSAVSYSNSIAHKSIQIVSHRTVSLYARATVCMLPFSHSIDIKCITTLTAL